MNGGWSTVVFGAQLWAARGSDEGRCRVRCLRVRRGRDGVHETVPSRAEIQVVASSGRRDCELTRVCCWTSGLETLVLRAGKALHSWDSENGTFRSVAEVPADDASQCSAVLDGPTLALLSPRRLLLQPLPPLDSPQVVVDLAEDESVQSILSGTSCEVLMSEEPCQQSWVLLCVLALEKGVCFVAATGTQTTRLAAGLFLGSLYENSHLTACLIVLPAMRSGEQVASLSHFGAAFRDNTTVACTASGSVLVVESGCPRFRCQLPFQDVARLQGSSFCGSVDFMLVWSCSGGAAVIRQDSNKHFQVGDYLEAGPEICCGDLLCVGSEQVVAWEPASGRVRCLQPSHYVTHDKREEEATNSSGQASQILVDLLQHHSGASQAALEKLRRAREQAEALLHETTREPADADNGSVVGTSLLPVLPLEQRPAEEPQQAAQVALEAKLLDSWAHIWGSRLLLGYQFSWPLSMEKPPTILVVSPGVTFGVRVSLDKGTLLIGANCRLPSGVVNPMVVCVLGGSLLRHQCEIDLERLPWPKQGRLPPRPALWSLTAAQHSHHFAAPTVAPWMLSSLEGLTRVHGALYICCNGASPLFQASAELLPEGALCLRAQDEEQLSLFEQWLWRQLPGAKEGAAPTCSPAVQTQLATLLRREAQQVRALLQESYTEARRSLHNTEWRTDFLAQLVTDRS